MNILRVEDIPTTMRKKRKRITVEVISRWFFTTKKTVKVYVGCGVSWNNTETGEEAYATVALALLDAAWAHDYKKEMENQDN